VLGDDLNQLHLRDEGSRKELGAPLQALAPRSQGGGAGLAPHARRARSGPPSRHCRVHA
jgi:hypothetical protein